MTHTFFLKTKVLAVLVVTVALFILPLIAVAQGGNTFPNFQGDNTSPNLQGGNSPPNLQGGNTLQNPLNVNSFPALLERLLQAALIIGIPIAVLFIVYAGLKLIMARGNPEQLKIARNHLLYTFIGIGLFIGAAVLVNILVQTLCQIDVRGIDQCN